MGQIIIIDGPEKAGKTTIINQLKSRLGWKVRKQSGPAKPNWITYLVDLAEDFSADGVTVWDRSWASEFVYRSLENGNPPQAWAMEFILGRLPAAKIMVLGPGADVTTKLRDDTDIQVSPWAEHELFALYADASGWVSLRQAHNKSALDEAIAAIWGEWKRDPAVSDPRLALVKGKLFLGVYDGSRDFVDLLSTPSQADMVWHLGPLAISDMDFIHVKDLGLLRDGDIDAYEHILSLSPTVDKTLAASGRQFEMAESAGVYKDWLNAVVHASFYEIRESRK